jgi:hypothetical protein
MIKSTLDKVTDMMSDAALSTVHAARSAVRTVTKAAEKAMPKKAAAKKTKAPAKKKAAAKKAPGKKTVAKKTAAKKAAKKKR